jgi:hypothetical protein
LAMVSPRISGLSVSLTWGDTIKKMALIYHLFPDLFVPPEQVLDTVDIYYKKERQRRISLRFLSWYVLKEPIQQETHDSIEDAKAALLLYKEFQRCEGEGKFDELLEQIYVEGKKYVSL